MPKAKGPNEKTSEATKNRLIEAAVAELRDSPRRDLFPEISLGRVAQRAGISRNGAALHFPTKEHLNQAVAEHLLMTDTVAASTYARSRSTPTEIEPPEDALRRLISDDLRSIVELPSWLAIERVTVEAGHFSGLRQVALDGYRADDASTWDHLLRPALDRLNRRPTSHQGRSIAAIYNALLEGAALRCSVDEDVRAQVLAGAGEFHTAYVDAQHAVLMRLTHPPA